MRLEPATPEHIPSLAAAMREADRLEVGACGRTPDGALTTALAASLWALTAIVDDEPHAMMGVSPKSMIEGVGVPWMLGSEKIYDSARLLVRHGPSIIGEMERIFPTLENFVSVSNDRAIRFLKHWNWEISERQVNIGGLAFVRFRNR